jgi:hypothetical protein
LISCLREGCLRTKYLGEHLELKSEGIPRIETRVHNYEFQKLYPSSSIISVIKYRTGRWAELVACMGIMRYTYTILVKNSNS